MGSSRKLGGEVMIRLDGTFDTAAAWGLRARLEELSEQERVVVDFGPVREFVDLGIAVVANGLANEPRPFLELRGLQPRQHRVFRYFGVDSGSWSVNPSSAP